MLTIYKLRALSPVDFAAEELKKYLRMMMPECGDIQIRYDPNAKEGFRLGLLEDFGLPFEGEDVVLDDVIHVDTDEKGGILAGSNPRSVLFAVYRFLRENGCRWLYPGVDGEHVPMQNIVPVNYHKLADHRFRGHCNEGAESQQAMMDTIDFYAKLELNVYMIEFDNPYYYYKSYYDHQFNTRYRKPEMLPKDLIKQWKRMCETEIAKRGLQFHDMGHGWTAEPFGLSSSDGWKSCNQEMTEEQRECLAMIKGVRETWHGVALNTNLCMSNPRVRTTMVKGIVEYAKKHTNVDYLHVWLADGSRNHCECEECQKMRPSDYYLMIMNELDEELTKEGLATRIVFIAYVDTLFSPEKVTINNPKRFSLLYAPITRSYTSSITQDTVIPEEPAYERNNWTRPRASEDNAAFLKAWQKSWKGPSFSYEYHYWKHQYMDPGIMSISRRIYEDILSLKVLGLDGFVEDGSQRSFFPNGFHMYIFAEALMNRDCDYEKTVEDYFSHIYGKVWKEALSYLQRVSAAFDYTYMQGEKSKAPEKSSYFNPDMAKNLASVKELAAEARAIVKNNRQMPTRPQSVSMRLLELHADYAEGVANFMLEKCQGHEFLARDLWEEFFLEFGKHEFEIERYFDHYLAAKSFNYILRNPKSFSVEEFI